MDRNFPRQRPHWCALLLLCSALVAPATAAPDTRIEGSGTPTIVFEAGLGDTGSIWRTIQSSLGDHCGRSVSYARAGNGIGSRASGPRDAEHVVDELRTMLASASLKPPYILVGHSLGGLYMQYFARRYPDEVRGLVLVDSTHWNQLGRIRAEAPASYRMIRVASLVMTGAVRDEFRASPRSGEEVLALPRSPVPTIVLSSTRAGPGESDEFRHLAAALQDEIAAQHAVVRHEYVAGAGHYIQRDKPEAVTRAIRQLAACDSEAAPAGVNDRR